MTVLVIFAANPVWAQSGAANVQGTIRDTSGGVIPAARVTLVHTATTRQYTTQTNAEGFFLLPSLPIGAYDVSAESTGLKRWTAQLELVAGQTAELKVTLEVGSTTTEVTVAGNVTPLVTTTDGTLATVLERARIDQLPLDGRNFTSLVLMTVPGATNIPGRGVPPVPPAMFGALYGTEALQDGAVLGNQNYGQYPYRLPGLDTVGEVRVETSNSSAKFNRVGTIVATTRAGTNAVHGSLFDTGRNSGFGVARSRTDFYDKPPHLVRNEFGASLGGPVYLPKLYNGRNKTFFFFAYEGYKLRQNTTISTRVPTAAMRNGDFSGLVNANGQLQVIYDPNTTQSADAKYARTPFRDNQIPAVRMSPLAKYLYSQTPLPTTADNPLVAPNWYGLSWNNTNQFTTTTRIDHQLSEMNNLFFRWSHNPHTQSSRSTPFNAAPTCLDGRCNAISILGRNDTGVANWTHNFGPTFFGETQLSVSRDYFASEPYGAGNADIASTLGLPNPFNALGMPRIRYSMAASGGMVYDSGINPAFNTNWILNFDQNFTKVYGRHELQFGFRYRHERLDQQQQVVTRQGEVSFNNLGNTGIYNPASGIAYSPLPNTGAIPANFFLGLGSYSANFSRGMFRVRGGERSGYLQDNIKVNSRLTLNFGLRYEYHLQAQTADNDYLGFDLATRSIVLPRPIDQLHKIGVTLPVIADAWAALGVKYETPQQAGLPSSLVYPNRWDFGPRAGFAWRIGSARRLTVVRGGYGLYAFPDWVSSYTAYLQNQIPGSAAFAYNPNAATQSPDGLPNFWMRSAPNVIAGVNSSNVIALDNPGGITRGGSFYFVNPHLPTSRTHSWNLTVERELPGQMVLTTGFAGTHGFRLGQYNSLNDAPNAYVWYTNTGQPLPTGAYASVATRPYDQTVYGTLQEFTKTGWSNNFSYQLKLQRRYSKGIAYQFFYVMSNALRAGGNAYLDSMVYPVTSYLKGAVPDDYQARNRLLNYQRDTGVPKHLVNWNFLVDLPFGKGKRFGATPAARSMPSSADGRWPEPASSPAAISSCPRVTGPTPPPSRFTARNIPSRTAAAGSANPATCTGTATLPATASTAVTPADSRMALRACHPITHPSRRR